MSTETNPTIKEIVRGRLMAGGYAGLCNRMGTCACKIDDLMHCDEMEADCSAGYLVEFGEGDICPCGGWCDFHIQEEKPDGN